LCIYERVGLGRISILKPPLPLTHAPGNDQILPIRRQLNVCQRELDAGVGCFVDCAERMGIVREVQVDAKLKGSIMKAEEGYSAGNVSAGR
jgi:hypothetical protein